MDPVMLATMVGVLGLGGFFLQSMPKLDEFPEKQDNSLSHDFSMLHRDFSEVGVSWGTQRADTHALINLNEVYKPRTAPKQAPTRNLDDIWQDQADIGSYLKQYGPQFHFMRDGSVPLHPPEQSNPNVEILGTKVSFKGDPEYSLTYYPRAYVDNHHGKLSNTTFSDEPETLLAGQPETWEVVRVPWTGRLNYQHNPYGPGGAVQWLNADRNERATRYHGTKRAQIMRPPQGGFQGSKYPL